MRFLLGGLASGGPAGDEGQVVLAVLAAVAEVVHEGADEVDAEAADGSILDGGVEVWGWGVMEGIEGWARRR